MAYHMILQAQDTALLDTARVDVASIAHAGTGEDALGEGTEDSGRGAHGEEKDRISARCYSNRGV